MKVATAEEMRTIDRLAMEEFHYPGIILMEHAADAVQRAICSRFAPGRVGIICGKGNNGGDGWALARLLHQSGYSVTVFQKEATETLPPDAEQNRKMALALGITTRLWSELPAAQSSSFTVLVDALLGTGFHGKVGGELAAVIEEINRSRVPVVAVDIPSGVEADTGKVNGPAVRAVLTVTFGLPKVGLLVYPGREYAGEVICDPIGLPSSLLEKCHLFYSLNDEEVLSRLPVRRPEAHKGESGHLLVIGGSAGMTGAPVLAGMAALRSGAGLVTLGIRDGLSLPEKPLELMVKPWSRLDFNDYRAIVIGPGLSLEADGAELVRSILKLKGIPRILDADALNLLATMENWWQLVEGPLILTPHPGEMARLVGMTSQAVQADRVALARTQADCWNVTLVLKGAATLVAAKGEPLYINQTGNPALATGGTGDILAGMIGGFLAQGLLPLQAAVTGVYLHGKAGDLAAAEIGSTGVLAGDLLSRIPRVMKRGEELCQ
ncbi:MAG: NAD(P)H-hydrate dehydratase [Firmicutes bacterium]|nr:NAD(P)H-hydrate dehydratase [Bacillota bacterium]